MTLPHRIVERGPAILHGARRTDGVEVTKVDRGVWGCKSSANGVYHAIPRSLRSRVKNHTLVDASISAPAATRTSTISPLPA